MANHPWLKWYPDAWVGDPELRLCHPSARSLLADIMSLCHKGKPYGYLKRKDGTEYPRGDLCKMLHYTPREFDKRYAELFRRTRIMKDDVGVYVPRLIKEKAKLDKFSAYGKRGGNPDLVPKAPAPVRKRKKAPPPRTFKYSPEFESFWTVYPRPIGKGKAAEAFDKARAAGITVDHLTASAKKYAAAVEGEALKYVKHPATWINEGCFDDVLDADQMELRRVSKRQATRRAAYEKDMKEYVSYIAESAASGVLLGAGSIADLIVRVSGDVKRALGEKAVADFEKRVKQYRKAKTK